MKTLKHILLLPLALMAVACGEEYEIESFEPTMAIEKRTTSIAGRDDQLRIGRSNCTLEAQWNFSNSGGNISWSASNSNVTITPEDYANRNRMVRIQANAVGTTTVTATLDGKSASYNIEVLHLADFKVSQDSYKMTYTFVANYTEFYRAEWDFGNGNTYTQYADSQYNGVYTYYGAKGTYNVTLSLYDRSGNLIDTFTKAVTLV